MLTQQVCAPRAFTLIEMLVVIAILSILAMLLMPALRSAKAQADLAACANSLRHIGLAALQYPEDNNQCLPPAAYIVPVDWGGGVTVERNLCFAERLLSYCGDLSLFVCRADNDPWVNWSYYTKKNFNLSYLANYNFLAAYSCPLVRIGKLTKPSQTLFFGPNADGDTTQYQLAVGAHSPLSCSSGYPPYSRLAFWRHGGGANYGFGDAHVSRIEAAEAMENEKRWLP